MLANGLHDVVAAHRVKPVDLAEPTVGLPPFLGECGETLDLLRIDRSPFRPRSIKPVLREHEFDCSAQAALERLCLAFSSRVVANSQFASLSKNVFT